MSSSTLRILLLDDNPHDRELTRRELRKEFPDVHVIELRFNVRSCALIVGADSASSSHA